MGRQTRPESSRSSTLTRRPTARQLSASRSGLAQHASPASMILVPEDRDDRHLMGNRGGSRRPRSSPWVITRLIHQNADGTVVVGASRSAALHDGAESLAGLRGNARRACTMVPGIASREVAATWTGLQAVLARWAPLHRPPRRRRRRLRRTRQRGHPHRRGIGPPRSRARPGPRAVHRPGAVSAGSLGARAAAIASTGARRR